jgi:hypothetical protein
MTISLIEEVRLNDLVTRSPALFSVLPFVPHGQSADPAGELGRNVWPSEATDPISLQPKNPTPEELFNMPGPRPVAQGATVPARTIMTDLLGQNIPSDNSIAVIAGSIERTTTPSYSIALYERTAQLAPAVHSVTNALGSMGAF